MAKRDPAPLEQAGVKLPFNLVPSPIGKTKWDRVVVGRLKGLSHQHTRSWSRVEGDRVGPSGTEWDRVRPNPCLKEPSHEA